MLIYRRTSILESSAQTLVNTVNCVGVMGKGLAKEFKDRDPLMFKAYKEICDRSELRPGRLWLWRGQTGWVLNFPTKDHWRNPSRLEWIDQGLAKFARGYAELGIREISFPRLGCGNGGLKWDDVRPIMEGYLAPLQIAVYIHDHNKNVGLPEHLESVRDSLALELGSSVGFPEFLQTLAKAIELAGSRLIDLQSHERIYADFRDETLHIALRSGEWSFNQEDLWGVWVSLQKGFLTPAKAGWTAPESGRSLISLLSLLPIVRIVEIQKFDSDAPELALELQHAPFGSLPAAASPSEQLALKWH